VGRGTIANVLKTAGIDPAPERRQEMTWKEFLNTHWDVLAATDFFTVELWTGTGLIRYHVLFVTRLATREVQIAGFVPAPNEEWLKRVARILIDPIAGCLRGTRWLIHDRASLFSDQFRQLFRNSNYEAHIHYQHSFDGFVPDGNSQPRDLHIIWHRHRHSRRIPIFRRIIFYHERCRHERNHGVIRCFFSINQHRDAFRVSCWERHIYGSDNDRGQHRRRCWHYRAKPEQGLTRRFQSGLFWL
jgi:hypothetical protein